MNALVPVGFILIFLGFILVTAGFFLSAEKNGAEVHGGGIIMIGPIPIVFGTDRKSATALVVLATVLIIVSIIFLLLARRIL